MNKALLILQREYLTRVKKKSFIITTLLVPMAFAALMVFSVFMSTKGAEEKSLIAVYDETGVFLSRLQPTELINFKYIPREEYLEFRTQNGNEAYNALLYIPQNLFASNRIQLYSNNQIARSTQSYLKRQLEEYMENDKRTLVFEEAGVSQLDQKLAATKTHLQLDTIKLNNDGTSSNISTELNTIIGFIAGFIIYMMILMYGAMVMRGVVEEKMNRISEVLVSSVKPIQLMFGKIIGIGLVGLTQFFIWIIFGGVLLTIGSHLISPTSIETLSNTQNIMASGSMPNNTTEILESNPNAEIFNLISSINIPLLLISFLIFFVLGYLLYASIMGAIGSAASNEEDAQQLVSIITIPLIMAIMLITPVGENPSGSLAFWTSIFPLFSPVCMMVRIPAGIPIWEIILSASLLLITTFACVWIAAKIYRTGILMYGKKVSLKEILKWIKKA